MNPGSPKSPQSPWVRSSPLFNLDPVDPGGGALPSVPELNQASLAQLSPVAAGGGAGHLGQYIDHRNPPVIFSPTVPRKTVLLQVSATLPEAAQVALGGGALHEVGQNAIVAVEVPDNLVSNPGDAFTLAVRFKYTPPPPAGAPGGAGAAGGAGAGGGAPPPAGGAGAGGGAGAAQEYITCIPCRVIDPSTLRTQAQIDSIRYASGSVQLFNSVTFRNQACTDVEVGLMPSPVAGGAAAPQRLYQVQSATRQIIEPYILNPVPAAGPNTTFARGTTFSEFDIEPPKFTVNFDWDVHGLIQDFGLVGSGASGVTSGILNRKIDSVAVPGALGTGSASMAGGLLSIGLRGYIDRQIQNNALADKLLSPEERDEIAETTKRNLKRLAAVIHILTIIQTNPANEPLINTKKAGFIEEIISGIHDDTLEPTPPTSRNPTEWTKENILHLADTYINTPNGGNMDLGVALDPATWHVAELVGNVHLSDVIGRHLHSTLSEFYGFGHKYGEEGENNIKRDQVMALCHESSRYLKKGSEEETQKLIEDGKILLASTIAELRKNYFLLEFQKQPLFSGKYVNLIFRYPWVFKRVAGSIDYDNNARLHIRVFRALGRWLSYPLAALIIIPELIIRGAMCLVALAIPPIRKIGLLLLHGFRKIYTAIAIAKIAGNTLFTSILAANRKATVEVEKTEIEKFTNEKKKEVDKIVNTTQKSLAEEQKDLPAPETSNNKSKREAPREPSKQQDGQTAEVVTPQPNALTTLAPGQTAVVNITSGLAEFTSPAFRDEAAAASDLIKRNELRYERYLECQKYLESLQLQYDELRKNNINLTRPTNPNTYEMKYDEVLKYEATLTAIRARQKEAMTEMGKLIDASSTDYRYLKNNAAFRRGMAESGIKITGPTKYAVLSTIVANTTNPLFIDPKKIQDTAKLEQQILGYDTVNYSWEGISRFYIPPDEAPYSINETSKSPIKLIDPGKTPQQVFGPTFQRLWTPDNNKAFTIMLNEINRDLDNALLKTAPKDMVEDFKPNLEEMNDALGKPGVDRNFYVESKGKLTPIPTAEQAGLKTSTIVTTTPPSSTTPPPNPSPIPQPSGGQQGGSSGAGTSNPPSGEQQQGGSSGISSTTGTILNARSKYLDTLLRNNAISPEKLAENIKLNKEAIQSVSSMAGLYDRGTQKFYVTDPDGSVTSLTTSQYAERFIRLKLGLSNTTTITPKHIQDVFGTDSDGNINNLTPPQVISRINGGQMLPIVYYADETQRMKIANGEMPDVPDLRKIVSNVTKYDALVKYNEAQKILGEIYYRDGKFYLIKNNQIGDELTQKQVAYRILSAKNGKAPTEAEITRYLATPNLNLAADLNGTYNKFTLENASKYLYGILTNEEIEKFVLNPGAMPYFTEIATLIETKKRAISTAEGYKIPIADDKLLPLADNVKSTNNELRLGIDDLKKSLNRELESLQNVANPNKNQLDRITEIKKLLENIKSAESPTGKPDEVYSTITVPSERHAITGDGTIFKWDGTKWVSLSAEDKQNYIESFLSTTTKTDADYIAKFGVPKDQVTGETLLPVANKESKHPKLTLMTSEEIKNNKNPGTSISVQYDNYKKALNALINSQKDIPPLNQTVTQDSVTTASTELKKNLPNIRSSLTAEQQYLNTLDDQVKTTDPVKTRLTQITAALAKVTDTQQNGVTFERVKAFTLPSEQYVMTADGTIYKYVKVDSILTWQKLTEDEKKAYLQSIVQKKLNKTTTPTKDEIKQVLGDEDITKANPAKTLAAANTTDIQGLIYQSENQTPSYVKQPELFTNYINVQTEFNNQTQDSVTTASTELKNNLTNIDTSLKAEQTYLNALPATEKTTDPVKTRLDNITAALQKVTDITQNGVTLPRVEKVTLPSEQYVMTADGKIYKYVQNTSKWEALSSDEKKAYLQSIVQKKLGINTTPAKDEIKQVLGDEDITKANPAKILAAANTTDIQGLIYQAENKTPSYVKQPELFTNYINVQTTFNIPENQKVDKYINELNAASSIKDLDGIRAKDAGVLELTYRRQKAIIASTALSDPNLLTSEQRTKCQNDIKAFKDLLESNVLDKKDTLDNEILNALLFDQKRWTAVLEDRQAQGALLIIPEKDVRFTRKLLGMSDEKISPTSTAATSTAATSTTTTPDTMSVATARLKRLATLTNLRDTKEYSPELAKIAQSLYGENIRGKDDLPKEAIDEIKAKISEDQGLLSTYYKGTLILPNDLANVVYATKSIENDVDDISSINDFLKGKNTQSTRVEKILTSLGIKTTNGTITEADRKKLLEHRDKLVDRTAGRLSRRPGETLEDLKNNINAANSKDFLNERARPVIIYQSGQTIRGLSSITETDLGSLTQAQMTTLSKAYGFKWNPNDPAHTRLFNALNAYLSSPKYSSATTVVNIQNTKLNELQRNDVIAAYFKNSTASTWYDNNKAKLNDDVANHLKLQNLPTTTENTINAIKALSTKSTEYVENIPNSSNNFVIPATVIDQYITDAGKQAGVTDIASFKTNVLARMQNGDALENAINAEVNPKTNAAMNELTGAVNALLPQGTTDPDKQALQNTVAVVVDSRKDVKGAETYNNLVKTLGGQETFTRAKTVGNVANQPVSTGRNLVVTTAEQTQQLASSKALTTGLATTEYPNTMQTQEVNISDQGVNPVSIGLAAGALAGGIPYLRRSGTTTAKVSNSNKKPPLASIIKDFVEVLTPEQRIEILDGLGLHGKPRELWLHYLFGFSPGLVAGPNDTFRFNSTGHRTENIHLSGGTHTLSNERTAIPICIKSPAEAIDLLKTFHISPTDADLTLLKNNIKHPYDAHGNLMPQQLYQNATWFARILHTALPAEVNEQTAGKILGMLLYGLSTMPTSTKDLNIDNYLGGANLNNATDVEVCNALHSVVENAPKIRHDAVTGSNINTGAVNITIDAINAGSPIGPNVIIPNTDTAFHRLKDEAAERSMDVYRMKIYNGKQYNMSEVIDNKVTFGYDPTAKQNGQNGQMVM